MHSSFAKILNIRIHFAVSFVVVCFVKKKKERILKAIRFEISKMMNISDSRERKRVNE